MHRRLFLVAGFLVEACSHSVQATNHTTSSASGTDDALYVGTSDVSRAVQQPADSGDAESAVVQTVTADSAVMPAHVTSVSSPDAGTPATTPSGPHTAPQFVLVGLDATPGHDTEHTFSRRMGDLAEQAGGRITYFINTQNFLINPARRNSPTLTERDKEWIDPDRRGYGMISYSHSADESEGRLATTRYLIEHGHEMGSHGVHHERGNRWTARQWQHEFEIFNRFHEGRLGLPHPLGFRAPYLSPGPGLGAGEQAVTMIYDSSHVLARRLWPGRLRGTNVWEIGVMSLTLRGCTTVIFDDGLRTCQMREETMFQALKEEFMGRYNGNRAPFVLSSHDGFVETVYMRLLRDVCHMPDVRCTTFSEVAKFMAAHTEIAMWGDRRGQQAAPPTITGN